MSDRFGRLEGARSALAFKAPVRAATTANITLSGYQTIDGVAFAANDDPLLLRILVKDQNDLTANGIYTVESGAWTRVKDFDGNTDFAKGTLVYVTDGGTNGSQIFRVTADVESVGEDNITFASLTSIISNEGYQRTSIFEYIPSAYHADIVDGTSVVDVSEYILDAIDELDKGILFFPAGKYIIDTEIYVSKPILFEGSGNAHQHDVGSEDYGTLFSWTGAAGGTMVRFEPVNGASAQRISGGGFVGIGLDGESLAGRGLVVRSVNDACFDFYGTGFVKASKTITAATNANPCVITSAAHGLASNDVVLIKSVGGMTELNGNRYVVTSVTTNTFALQGINSTAYGVYTSSGTAEINGYVCYVGVTLGTLGEAKDTQYNKFRIFGKQLGASSGPVLMVDGDSINNLGNTSRNHFEEILAIHQFDDGVVIGNSDDNVFTKAFTFDFTGGLDGIKLLGASSLSNVCGQNYFLYAGCAGPSGGRFVAMGTAAYPVAPAACKIEFWDYGNASAYPVINAGATVYYWVADGSGTSPFLWNLGQSILAQKLLLYQSGNDKFGFGMASGAMRIFSPSNAKVSFGTISTSDGSTYTESGYLDSTGYTGTINGFTQAGTGAVSRTYQAKMRDWVSVLDFNADSTGVSNSATAFTNANTTGKTVYVPAGTYLLSSAPTVNAASWIISPGATFTGAGAVNGTFSHQRGFYTDIGDGASIWRFRDRLFLGDASEIEGTKSPGVDKTWVGNSANGLMAYFEARAQAAIFATQGTIALTLASRTSDNADAENTCIGLGSFVDNDRTSSAQGAWGGYIHAVRRASAGSVSGLEIDVINAGAVVTGNPYTSHAMTDGTTAVLWLNSGGESAGALGGDIASPNRLTCCAHIGSNAAASGARFDKGIVFQSNALYGTDADGTGTGVAIGFARNHEQVWYFSGSDTARALTIRADGNDAARQSRLIADATGFSLKGVQSDLATENHLFRVIAPTITGSNATNFLTVTPTQTGGGLITVSAANSTDTNVSIAITPKGSGFARIDGTILNGHTSTLSADGTNTPSFQVHGTDSPTSSGMFSRWQANAGGSSIYLNHSRGAVGTHTILSASDNIGSIWFYGSDGTAFIPAVRMRAIVNGTPGTNDMPGALILSATADGAASVTDILTLTSAGIDVVGDVRTDTFRIDQAATAVGTGTKTISNAADSSTNFGKYFSFSLNGTTVYVPCGTVEPT